MVEWKDLSTAAKSVIEWVKNPCRPAGQYLKVRVECDKVFNPYKDVIIFVDRILFNEICKYVAEDVNLEITERTDNTVEFQFTEEYKGSINKLYNMKKLIDVVPWEAKEYETVQKYADVKVIKEYSLGDEEDWLRWPGKHKNVMNWYVLENGKAIGWNENPAVGWSFPVITYNE